MKTLINISPSFPLSTSWQCSHMDLQEYSSSQQLFTHTWKSAVPAFPNTFLSNLCKSQEREITPILQKKSWILRSENSKASSIQFKGTNHRKINSQRHKQGSGGHKSHKTFPLPWPIPKLPSSAFHHMQLPGQILISFLTYGWIFPKILLKDPFLPLWLLWSSFEK